MLMPEEIDRRRPVWLALSELWLDTELQEEDLKRIATIMRQSGYDQCKLRCIYLREVAPVIYHNLLSPVGEWNGFDESWLSDTIVQNMAKTGFIHRVFALIRQPLTIYATEHHWRKLKMLLDKNSN